MREQHGAEHDLFRQLVRFGFDHHHRIVSGGDDEVEVAFGNLFVGRVQDIFAIDIADARGADRAHEGHARDGERGRRGDHREDVGLVVAVTAQNQGNNVDFVIVYYGEKQTDRTIGKTT